MQQQHLAVASQQWAAERCWPGCTATYRHVLQKAYGVSRMHGHRALICSMLHSCMLHVLQSLQQKIVESLNTHGVCVLHACCTVTTLQDCKCPAIAVIDEDTAHSRLSMHVHWHGQPNTAKLNHKCTAQPRTSNKL
jgi:hypothetical protein